MSAENSTSTPNSGSEPETHDVAPTNAAETSRPAQPTANPKATANDPLVTEPRISSSSVSKSGEGPTGTAKTGIAGKGAAPPKLVEKTATAASPAELKPSLPASMVVRPDSTASANSFVIFPGELEESFESALARVQQSTARHSLWARILGALHGRPTNQIRRNVAFDGFRAELFEDKRERDRRYGTVYTVSEQANAFIVRLELPRLMPKSSLRHTWGLPDEMPDYACALELNDNVLCIRAGLSDEARRRLSYVSSSFPTDFQTRIEFPAPVNGYRHRLQNKLLEVIVYKESGMSA
jgi:hypothetical protein